MASQQSQWLLVEVLNPDRPTVVASGPTVKKMVPLSTFLRGAHAGPAARVVHAVHRTGAEVQKRIGPNRTIFSEPITDEGGVVRAVWLCIADEGTELPPHGRAWPFLWNLDRGVATVSEGLNCDRARESGPPVHSIAEALSAVDFGENAAAALSTLIKAVDGSSFQQTVRQHRPEGPDYYVNVVALVGVQRAGDVTERVVAGLSHELGPAESRHTEIPSLASAVTSAIVQYAHERYGEYFALTDLASLEILQWCGEAPTEIAWELGARRDRGRIHPDDVHAAQSMAHSLIAAPISTQVQGALRFLTRSGNYSAFRVNAIKLDLGPGVHAALVVLQRSMPS